MTFVEDHEANNLSKVLKLPHVKWRWNVRGICLPPSHGKNEQTNAESKHETVRNFSTAPRVRTTANFKRKPERTAPSGLSIIHVRQTHRNSLRNSSIPSFDPPGNGSSSRRLREASKIKAKTESENKEFQGEVLRAGFFKCCKAKKDLSFNQLSLSDQILGKSEYKNNPTNKKIVDIYREITILLQSSNRYTQISSFYKQIKVDANQYNSGSRVYVTAARHSRRKRWKF